MKFIKFVKTKWKNFVLRLKRLFGIDAKEPKKGGLHPTIEKVSDAMALNNLPHLVSASSISTFVTKQIIPLAKGNVACQTISTTFQHGLSWVLAHLGFKSLSAKIAATSATVFGSACLGIGVFVVCFGLFLLLAPHTGPAVAASQTASLAHEVYHSGVAALSS